MCPKVNYTNDLVSVIVPVYNAERFLAETLDSLAAQTYEKIEVLLVDDGSSDSSKDICESYTMHDARFRYVYQENSGAGAARNHGMDLARGEFIMFLDSDDLFEPNLISVLHKNIKDYGADVVMCCADSFDTDYVDGKIHQYRMDLAVKEGVCRPSDIASRFFQDLSTCPWDKIFRASYVASKGLRFQTLRYSNDTYFVLMSMLSATRIGFVEDVLVHYRYGQGGSLRDKMYLDPFCDLEMLHSLRTAVAGTELAVDIDLRNSLDAFTAALVADNCLVLASQSEQACGEFLDRLKMVCIPDWGLIGFPAGYGSPGRSFKYHAVTTLPASSLSWALSPLGNNGWRGADKCQKLLVYSRLFVALLSASFKGGAVNSGSSVSS